MLGFKKKRIISLFMSAVMMTAAFGICGSSAFAKETDSSADTVFHEIASPLDSLTTGSGDEVENSTFNIDSVYTANGNYYVKYSDYSDNGSTSLVSFDKNGENVHNVTLPSLGENSWISNISTSKDGRNYVVWGIYTYGGLDDGADAASLDDEEEDAYIDAFTDAEDLDFSSWKITCADDQGKEIWTREIDSEDSLYFLGMVSNEKITVLMTDSDVHVFDNSDGKEKLLSLPDKEFYGNVCLGKDGQVLFVGNSDDTFVAWKLDAENGKYDKLDISLKNFYYDGIVVSGSGDYDFYTSNERGIYGFKADSPDSVLILDYSASDILVTYASSFAVLNGESVLLIISDLERGMVPMLLKKTDPSQISETTVLTLGCVFADMDLRKAVVDFNKSNQKYRINIIEYPNEEGSEDSWSSQLNVQIASGNIPDMIGISSDMPIQSYASKGLFEDIEGRFKNDPEISKNTYLTNVLDAFKIDGKMYFTVPDFTLSGLMGRKSDFKDTKGVTVEQLKKMIDERKLSYDTALGITTRDIVLSWAMNCAMSEYVDWEKGTCSFNSDSFVDLLEFSAKFPKDFTDDETAWEQSDGWLREQKQIVREAYLYDFSSYMQERYGYIGEEAVYMGYPGNGENGPVIQDGGCMIAMSSSASSKDGCWEFMRRFYLDEYQENISYKFPVSKKALENKGKEAMKPSTYVYTDETGQRVSEEVKDYVYVAGMDVEIPKPTDADISDVMAVIEKVDKTAGIDMNINKIIAEETGAFFEGQKSARETADIIQSRVQVYISETK